MIFIGDIHGRFTYYTDLIKNITHSPTVQVGDLGIGFPGYPHPSKFDGDNWFIRGNHDKPEEIRKHPNYLGDYGYRKDWDLFYIGGADSIDKNMRTEGVDWWRDEELDYLTLNNTVIPLYEKSKPRMMVTHTCPMSVKTHVLSGIRNGWGNGNPSVTERALDAMFEVYQPDVWVFGHFHKHIDFRTNGTRFICLREHQMIEIRL